MGSREIEVGVTYEYEIREMSIVRHMKCIQ